MRVGVDTGGTFTDAVAVDDEGRLRFAKVPSTPERPEEAVLRALAALGAGAADEVVHGTTVATNALLERSGGPTALVATRGFEDVLVLRRQARPRLYALEPEVGEPLAPDELRLGVDERLGADGGVLRALDPAALDALVAEVRRSGARSVAVALLHAYADPRHERALADALAPLGLPVSLSSEVLPEHREYERTATTVADAYVAPTVAAYLGRLDAALGGARLRVMQSSGGAAAAEAARRHPVRTLLSGPAAGVIGARAAAAAAGVDRFISFDMGGTSTDVALVDGGEPELTREGEVAGLPIAVPSLPVHTVGAGGGSIARLDAGGALAVGPASAAAHPGPACYRRGGALPTVTDAALVDGRLDADHFLGGAMRLDAARAAQALVGLAGPVAEAARGIARVATAVMARAIRAITVERGHDPRDFVLVAFGGAGGLFACDVADELQLPRVLVPPAPGLLCAYGALAAEVTRDYARTLLRACAPVEEAAALDGDYAPLAAAAHRDLAAEGVPPGARRLERRVDLRYAGQSYELSIPLPPASPFDYVAAFHAAHQRRFGFALPGRAVERVALRVHARGLVPPPPPLATPREPGEPRLADGTFARARLPPGATVDGPARIVELSATTWLPAGWRATVDDAGALHLLRR